MEQLEKPDEFAVRAQLGRILTTTEFRRSPVLAKMLKYIVEAALEETTGDLNASVLARRALGKGSEFRSSQDSSVRVAVNRLRSAIKLYYAETGRGDDVEIVLNPGSLVPVLRHRLEPQSNDTFTVAINTFDQYQRTATQKYFTIASKRVEAAVLEKPDRAPLQAAKAELLMDSIKHGYQNNKKALEEAFAALELANQLDPHHQSVVAATAMWEMMQGNTELVLKMSNNLCKNPTDRADFALGVWFATVADGPPSEVCATNFTTFSGLNLPSWIYHAPFLAAYDAGDYEAALNSAIAFGMPDFVWGGLDRAAALAQLGLYKAANHELSLSVKNCPALIDSPESILKAYIPSGDIWEHMLEGFKKAGLQKLN